MNAKEHPDTWKNSIRKKLNQFGWPFNVERDWDGSFRFDKFDRDPAQDWEYQSENGMWHERARLEELDDLAIETEQLADGLPSFGANVTRDEKIDWIREWEAAANKWDELHPDA